LKHFIDLITKEVFAYELDGSQDHLIRSDLVPINDADLANLKAQKQSEAFDALSYDKKRLSEYPPIGDQLDALFHAGVFPADMAAKIQAVKTKYPKG
jgi:hypothetical protein